MYQIVSKEYLNASVVSMDISAPTVAARAKAGQFIILRVNDEGERIPLTVAGYDRARGTVRIIFQTVGASTMLLAAKEAGECIADFVGPLGKATEVEGFSRVLVVGGGVGCAIALPVVQALYAQGCSVHAIVGFRNKDLVILEQEFAAASDALTVMTDDGSYGRQGNVTQPLKELLERGECFDRVITIGPLIMMKYVVETLRPYKIPVIVSMNPIMIDGTGMCGGCRLSVGGKTRFACVDGPEFDGYEVDFDEAMSRGNMYRDFEAHAREAACNLLHKEVE